MFEKFTKVLGLKSSSQPNPQHDLHLATAALMVYVSQADGEFSADERAALTACLQDQFGLATDAVEQIITDAEAQQRDSTCLYKFTRAVTTEMDQQGRQDIVRMLWRVALADNHIDNFEANMLAKVAGLLGVTTRDRVLLKQEVEASLSGQE